MTRSKARRAPERTGAAFPSAAKGVANIGGDAAAPSQAEPPRGHCRAGQK